MVESWKVWKKNKNVEARTFQRVKNRLFEMESAKQLRKIILSLYKPGMKILDVGCASGHYYNSVKKIDKNISYCGLDPTTAYINFAKKHFKKNNNVKFILADINNPPKSIKNKFDITFCCNVLLHLPTLNIPLKNLISTSKRYCIVRTLISDKTHISKYLYSDTYDKKGNPKDFVYQNTYSYDYFEKITKSAGNYSIKFLNDEFNSHKINNEFNKFKKKQDAVTKVMNNVQLAGSKVFQWKWAIIKK